MRRPECTALYRGIAALVVALLGLAGSALADDLRCSPRVERAVDVGADRE